MLVLSRKPTDQNQVGSTLFITDEQGNKIEISVLSVCKSDKNVRLGIKAPKHMNIFRDEHLIQDVEAA